MKKLNNYEFLDKLKEDFPKLFSEKPRCGFSCPQAWYTPVYNASAAIEELMEHSDEIMVAQVKEKFGDLRFYVDVIKENLHDDVHEIIMEAESECRRVCVKCGCSGELVEAGWGQKVCKECYGAGPS